MEVSLNEEFLKDNKIDKTFLRNSCRNAVISESNDGKIRIRGNYEEIKELHEKLQKNTSEQLMSSGAHSQIKETRIAADTRLNISTKTKSTCNGILYENKKDVNKHFKQSVNGDRVVTGRPPLRAVRATKFTRDCNDVTRRGDCRSIEPTKKKSEVIHKSPERKRKKLKDRDEDAYFANRFQKLNIKKYDGIDGPESFSMILDVPCDGDNDPSANSICQSISTFREQRECLETEPHGMIQGISHGLITLRPSLRSDTMNSLDESLSTSGLQNGRDSESTRKNILTAQMDSIANFPSHPSYQSNLSSETIREDRSPMPMESIASLPNHQSDLSSNSKFRENRSLKSNIESFIKLSVNSLSSESIIQDASLGSNLDPVWKGKDAEESFIVLKTDR